MKIYTSKIEDNPLDHDIFHGSYHGADTGPGTITYHGEKIEPRNDLVNHSPNGLTWGFFGSGSSQAALAILASSTSDEIALKHYMAFVLEVVSSLPKNGDFRIEKKDVKEWVQAKEGVKISSQLSNEPLSDDITLKI